MTREELQKVHDALSLLNCMVNCGEQHSPTSVNMTQAAFAILRKPLPPAEGAEEILRKNCNTCYSRSTGEEEVWSSVSSVLIAMQDFATLHAQRIAEKMVEWVSVKDKLPEERENVLCYNGYRISSHNWCKYTDQDDDWFKKTFTHWCKLPKIP